MDFEYPHAAAESCFDNGFAALHYSSARYASVSLRLCVRTGSIDEGEFSGTGISHFAEHMVFNGAGALDKRQMAAKFAEIGALVNAYTFYDRTVYCVDVPSENAPTAMSMLADMVFRPAFDADSFALERDVILREIDMCADDFDDVLACKSNRATFDVHPLRFPIIGEREAFAGITFQELQAYCARRYVPQNMILVCASDIADESFFSLAEKYFGKEKFGRLEVPTTPKEPEQTSLREVRCVADCAVARGMMTFRLPHIDAAQTSALDAFSFAMTAGNSGKLVRKFKYAQNLVDSIDSEVLRVGGMCLLSFFYECSAKNAQVVRAELLRDLKDFAAAGLSETERKKFVSNSQLSIANAQRNAASMSEYLLNLRFPCMDAPVGDAYIAAFERLSDADIKQVCTAAIDCDKLTFAQMSPKTRAKKCAVKKTISLSEPRVERLSNGLLLAMLPDDESCKTHLRLISAGGAQVLTQAQRGYQGLAAISVLRDTQTRGAADLAEFIESNALSFNSAFGDAFSSIFAESLPRDWRKTIELISDATLRLKISSDTFETERSALITDILDDMEDPSNAAFALLRKEFFGAKRALAFSPDGEVKSIENATPKAVAEVLKNLFSPSESVLCACGKFDCNELADACDSAFSAMRSSQKRIEKALISSAHTHAAARSAKLNRVQSAIFAAMPCSGISDSRSYYPRLVLQEILGGEDGVVFERVREREGLAYGAGASSVANFNSGMFYFSALSAAENLSRIEDIFGKIIAEYSGGAIDENKFSSARRSLISKTSMALEDISMRAFTASSGLILNNEIDDAKTLAAKISSVTIADVADCAAAILRAALIFKAV